MPECQHPPDLQLALEPVLHALHEAVRDTADPAQPCASRSPLAEAKLAARNMSVASLHGELTKQQRQTTLAAFRRGARARLSRVPGARLLLQHCLMSPLLAPWTLQL